MTELLGLHLEAKDLSALQVCLRGVIVFIAALVIARIADRRFMAKMSAFDVILGFMLASMLARAINGSAAFWPTLAGGFVLVLLHRLLAAWAFRSERMSALLKGNPDVLVENGQKNARALRRFCITDADLQEEMHLNGTVDKLEHVKKATMERSGQVSIVKTQD